MEVTVLNQRYRLEELIGSGGMATVYGGHDLLLDRPVAIKVLREPYANAPAFRERFVQEARAAARLDHPHIVHIYDVGEDTPQHPYIVMELVKGEDLKNLIRRERPLPVSRALNLIRQVCAGVGYAHRAGLVHCDLKPQNILVTEGGQIKVADFGIARAFRADAPASGERERVVWGSPHYIAPEQAAGEPLTPASDVYSIGVVFYEMLTGVPPFHAQDPTELVLKHLREHPPPLTSLNPRVPPGLDWLVQKILTKEPTGRYRNADQLGMALEEYMRHGEELTMPRPAASNAPADPEQTTQPTAAKSSAESRKSSDDDTGPDWLMWGMLFVATLAVLGVIALWNHVFQVYTQPSGTPLPIIDDLGATPTPSGVMVTVPQLIGLSAPDAQRLANGLQLDMAVIREQETSDARPGTILEQEPAAGARVPERTTIEVVLAQGRAFTLQDVEGYQLDTVRDGLESEGLLLEIVEVGSQESAGMILKQQPTGGTQIRAGSTLTLTVSGGPDAPLPLQVNLDNMVILEDARISQATFRPGEGIGVTLRWRCLKPLPSAYKVFVHFLTPDLQTLIAQDDAEPVNGLRPTTTWVPGEIIPDPHQLTIPEGTAPGMYQIRVGLYDENGRLSVVDAGNTETAFDSILITSVEVKP